MQQILANRNYSDTCVPNGLLLDKNKMSVGDNELVLYSVGKHNASRTSWLYYWYVLHRVFQNYGICIFITEDKSE